MSILLQKPHFASKYSCESSRWDLHSTLLCTALESEVEKLSDLNFLFTNLLNCLLLSANFNECLPTFARFCPTVGGILCLKSEAEKMKMKIETEYDTERQMFEGSILQNCVQKSEVQKILPEFADFCRNSKSRRIRDASGTNPGRIRTHPESVPVPLKSAFGQ